MRLGAAAAAVLLTAAAAAAQVWAEFAYPADSFSVAFPAEPRVESGIYQAVDGRPVEARVYSVSEGGGLFKMTVVDLPDPALQESAVLEHAVKTLVQGRSIKVDIPHRISRVYGRQLSLAAADGGISAVAVFFHKQRLYQIEGTVLPGGARALSDAIRFQQSLAFTDDSTNR